MERIFITRSVITFFNDKRRCIQLTLRISTHRSSAIILAAHHANCYSPFRAHFSLPMSNVPANLVTSGDDVTQTGCARAVTGVVIWSAGARTPRFGGMGRG